LPVRRVHLKFDEYLWDHGIIPDTENSNTVHDRMDRGLVKYGPDHRYVDFYHSEEGIRDWLRGKAHLFYQETLTKYLRIALGHLCLDDMASRHPEYDEDQLIKSAYRSFIQKGYHRKYFRY